MEAKDLIERDLPTLTNNDTVGKALLYMAEEKLSQLVLIKKEGSIGLIEEEILLNFDENSDLSNIPFKHENIQVHSQMHLLELADYLLDKDIDVCPVFDDSKAYLGCFKTIDLFKKVLQGQFSGSGGIMSLQIDQKDYSLSDISRIIESEGLRIERLYLAKKSVQDYQFIIKLNKENIKPAVNSLQRFGYKITQHSDFKDDSTLAKDRYGLLMKYLEI